MKVVAYSKLHYGTEYLASAIRSVIDRIDEYWCLYTPVGSYGYTTARPCPDSVQDLYNIAQRASGAKFNWYAGRPGEWTNEGAHGDTIRRLAPDADVYVTLDHDEIWADGLLAAAIDYAVSENAYTVRLPMVHLWRSFWRGMAHDPAFPERVKYVHGERSTDVTLHERGRIFHFGYAQRAEIVEYKQWVHGHRGEWRRDDWFNTKFAPNAQDDVHPVNLDGWWNAEPVDPFALGLPEWMREHPYAEMEMIP